MTATPLPVDEPRSEDDLLELARGLAGYRVGELSSRIGVPQPETQRRAKGFVGTMVEQLLGVQKRSAKGPDLPLLGVEIKTVPVMRDGTPRESTFVCCVPLHTIADLDWADSPVRAKLRRVLWIPIEAEPDIRLAERRVGAPLLWRPSETEDSLLRDDWDHLAGLMGRGVVEAIDARQGHCLQVRPKAASSRVMRRALDEDGLCLAMPRGFYLRARFTKGILERLLRTGS